MFDSKEPNSSSSWCPNRIFNIGNDNGVKLLDFISTLEKELGLEAKKDFESLQKGDVINTLSDLSSYEMDEYTSERTLLRKGVKRYYIRYRR